MHFSKTLVSLALVVTALSAPTPLFRRQSGGAECGSNDYSSSDISAAANAACDYLSNGEQVGSNHYPHQYNDYEGFPFSTSSPWYEFPILASGRVFDGNESPGPDRVVINDNCDLTAVLTHTGASGNNFNECSY